MVELGPMLRRLRLAASLTAAFGCAAQPATERAPHARIAENVSVIEEPALVAAPGHVRLPRAGNEALLARTPGDVLVSRHRGGLLRRVRSIDATEETIRIETEPAALSEVFVDARIREHLSLGAGATRSAVTDGSRFVDARSAALGAGGFDLTLGPRRIEGRPNVEIELLEGEVDFDPDMDLDVAIDDGELKRLAMRVAGNLRADLKIRVHARGKDTFLDVDQKLWSRERLYLQILGGVPVVETIKLDFGVGVEGTATGEIEAVLGGAVDAEVEAGADWEDEEWHDLGTHRIDVSGDAPKVNGKGRLDAARAYLYVRISVKLYDIAGPFVDVRPNVYFERSDDGWNAASAGLRGEFGVLAGLPVIDLTTGVYRSLLFDVSYPLDRGAADAPDGDGSESSTVGSKPADGSTDGSGSACPSIPAEGVCRDGLLEYCDGGVERSLDCTNDGKGCGWRDDLNRHGCVDGCGDLDFNGTCRGGSLRYCAYGSVRVHDCEKECGHPTGSSAYFCL